MNKKLLKGLLIATVIVGGMGSLSSCKDTDEDLFTQLKYDNLTVRDRVTTLEAGLQQVKDAQAACKEACTKAIDALTARMTAAEKEIADLKQQIAVGQATGATKQELQNLTDQLQALKDKTAQDINTAVQDIANLKNQYESLNTLAANLQSQITILNGKYEELESYVNGKFDDMGKDLQDKYDALVALITQNQVDIANLLANKADKSDVQALNGEISTIKNDITSVQGQIDLINNKIENCADKATVNALQGELETAKARLTALEDMLKTYEELRDRVATLEGRMDQMDKIYQPTIEDLQDIRGNALKGLQAYEWIEQMRDQLYTIDQINALLNNKLDKDEFDEFKEEFDALKQQCENYVTNDELNDVMATVRQEFTALYDQAMESIGDLDQLVGTHYQEFQDTMEALREEIEGMKGNIAANMAELADLGEKFEALQGSIDGNTQRISDVEDAVRSIQQQLVAMSSRIDQLNDRLNRMVTGILIQGTVNPVFGSFSTPVGIQSNCLLTYYGYNNGGTTEFPNLNGSSRGTYNDEIPFTQGDVRMIQACGGAEIMTLQPDQPIIPTHRSNAGRVYVTVNPSNVDFTGATLDLTTSQGKKCGVVLDPLRKSDKELTFGYSRANAGFYEADAYLDPKNIGDVKLIIDEGLKTAVKDLVHDRSKNTLAHLAKALYDQIDGLAPAYALRAAYNADKQEEMAYVVSQYNLMTTAVKPLSFKSLYGRSYGDKADRIPDLAGALAELHFEITHDMNVHFNWTDIKGEDINITIGLSPCEFNYTEDMNITVDVNGDTWIGDTDGHSITIKWTDAAGHATEESIQQFLDAFADEFNRHLDGWNKELENQVRDAIDSLLDQVNSKVQQALDDAAAEMNQQFDDMMTDINSQLNDKINNFVDRFDRLVNLYERARDRVIRFLENPNHYMQPVMFYKANSEVHFLSADFQNPTWVKANGGDAVSLYATTYNAEIVAPTFSKFVAVTNVYTADRSQSAQSGNQTCLSLLKKSNNSPTMLHQLPGRNSRIAMPLATTPGYIYEISYSGLDYHGITSTRRFYLQVK